jgi:hypothetical protein
VVGQPADGEDDDDHHEHFHHLKHFVTCKNIL